MKADAGGPGQGVSLDRTVFDQPSPRLAAALIGCTLTVEGVGGRIVETEAYDVEDPASHSFRGPTRRNAAMFGPAGRAYVYRIYGLHWCFNITCDAERPGSAVLIRALEPTLGLRAMMSRRGTPAVHGLCAGPGRLCQALAITGDLTGAPVWDLPFQLLAPVAPPLTVSGRRVGVSVGVETPWRFVEAGSAWLSQPLR